MAGPKACWNVNGLPQDLASFRGRVYQGVWGTAPFQSLYQPPPSHWSLTLSPEWYLVIGALAIGFVLSLGWSASSIFGLLILTSLILPVSQAWMNARQAKFSDKLRKGLLQALRLRV